MGWRAPGLGCLLVGMCLASTSVSSQSSGGEATETETKAPPADEAGVSMEFLEFLGTWESTDGEWVDPTEVQSADWPAMTDDSTDTGAGSEN